MLNMRIAAWGAILVLLFSICSSALADNQPATAFITSDTSDRVHLRARPSKSADSLGLYFTGTPVVYTGSLDAVWVSVQIGSERGYMISAYLTDELVEASLLNEAKTGIVRTSSWLNLRAAPSTNARSLMQLRSGQRVVILGETNTHWYYVSCDGMAGYAKADYIEREARPHVRNHMTSDILDVINGERVFWHTGAEAYMYIHEVGERCYVGQTVTFPRFAIADVDHDNIDELILVQAVENDEYYGFLVLNSVDGQVWGHEVFYRGMLSLKTDGTFSFSSGAADNGFGYMKQRLHIAESVSSEAGVEYFLNGQKVSENVFASAVAMQDQKPDAIWYDLTNRNLSSVRRLLTD